jgi:hypothetical protein
MNSSPAGYYKRGWHYARMCYDPALLSKHIAARAIPIWAWVEIFPPHVIGSQEVRIRRSLKSCPEKINNIIKVCRLDLFKIKIHVLLH